MAFTREEFNAVKIGAVVGAVDGPGQSPKNNLATVVQKVEDRWGLHLVVEFKTDERGSRSRDTVTGFTKVGIGWYDMGYTADEVEKLKSVGFK